MTLYPFFHILQKKDREQFGIQNNMATIQNNMATIQNNMATIQNNMATKQKIFWENFDNSSGLRRRIFSIFFGFAYSQPGTIIGIFSKYFLYGSNIILYGSHIVLYGSRLSISGH